MKYVKGGIKVNCLACGIPTPKWTGPRPRKYCSVQCWRITAKRKEASRSCSVCGRTLPPRGVTICLPCSMKK